MDRARTRAALLVCALTSLSAAAPVPPSPSTPDVATALKDIQAAYAVTTVGADFEQTYLVKAYDTKKISKGHVVFSRPASVDWRYSAPSNNRVVSDGVTVSYFDAANMQVHRQAAGQSQYEALALLQGNLASECNLTVLPGARMAFPGGYVLLCDPKTPTAAYSKILFYVEQPTSLVRRVVLLDAQGNRNRFDFDQIAINPPLLLRQFVIGTPPGTAAIGTSQATTTAPAPSHSSTRAPGQTRASSP